MQEIGMFKPKYRHSTHPLLPSLFQSEGIHEATLELELYGLRALLSIVLRNACKSEKQKRLFLYSLQTERTNNEPDVDTKCR